MSKNIILKAENVSKQYRLGQVGTGTLSHDLNRWWHQVRGKENPYLKIGDTNDRSTKGTSDYVWALKDINFEINQGDAVGIIGKNGAGKSTLLKILSKVTAPTTGIIKSRGRIASLLEVGTGFNPELTGKENIYLNGAILGMRKHEITSKLDEIIDFSGVERYIDTPVKRYSSGMYVRLAFAVAAYLESEILIVDEVLAVGDAEFQKKCLGKMGDISKGEGRTVLFVSHNLGSIASFCTKSMLLENGSIKTYDDTKKVISMYLNDNNNILSYWENKGAEFNFKQFKPSVFCMVDREYKRTSIFPKNETIGILIEGEIEHNDKEIDIGFALYDSENNIVFMSVNRDMKQSEWIGLSEGKNKIVGWIPADLLNEGDYRVELVLSIRHGGWLCKPELNSPNIYFAIKGGFMESPNWIEARAGLLAPNIIYNKLLY